MAEIVNRRIYLKKKYTGDWELISFLILEAEKLNPVPGW